MAASFPNAKKTFSAVVNGVTKLVAALFNTPYDEIEAIETFIGATGGGAQSYYTSLTDMLINYRRGCAVEYKGDADLYVRSGEIMIVDSSGNRRLRRNTSDTTVTWSDIDTGSEATSTLYYVYAVADANATTFTVLISTNSSAPSGATYYRLIGMFYNNSSGNIKFPYSYDVKGFFSGEVQVFSGAAPTSFTDLNLSGFIGAGKKLVLLKVKPTSGDGTHYQFRTNGESDDIESIQSSEWHPGGVSIATPVLNKAVYLLVHTDASGIIEWMADAADTSTITVLGFTT